MASDRHPDPHRDRPGPRVLVAEAGPDLAAGRAGWPGPQGHEARLAPNAPGLRILVVEDDPDLAASLAAWLALHGHQARVAPDGPAALRAAGDEPPDVVLLDIGLPGMDGYWVAERVQEELAPAMPKAPLLIAVTGRGGEDDRRRSRQAGIHLHLTKPVDVEELSYVLGRFQEVIG